MYILCIHHVYTMYTPYIYYVYTMYILCIHHVYTMYTPCIYYVYTMYILCIHHVYTMYTPCTLNVHTSISVNWRLRVITQGRLVKPNVGWTPDNISGYFIPHWTFCPCKQGLKLTGLQLTLSQSALCWYQDIVVVNHYCDGLFIMITIVVNNNANSWIS